MFDDDYKTQLDELIKDNTANLRSKPLDTRIKAIETLIDAYIEQTEYVPSSTALYNLSSIILYDYMEGDTRPDKITLEEYPIMTQRQYDFRTRAKRSGGEKGRMEIPLEVASYVGTDGNSHTLPIRRYK